MRQIAIDGPAGSGKSTVARYLANKLNYLYIDTGAMYRAVTLLALENNIGANDEIGLKALLATFDFHFEKTKDGQRIFLGDREITQDIRTQKINANVACYAQIPLVRTFLSDYQRNLAQTNSVVMDGRDIGTVILPFASDKFFLTASPEVRADRRTKELYPDKENYQANYETILKGIIQRDRVDESREIAPLKKAEDAILINTDNKTIEEVIVLIENALS